MATQVGDVHRCLGDRIDKLWCKFGSEEAETGSSFVQVSDLSKGKQTEKGDQA